MDETTLYRFCDYILRETKLPIAAFFLSDGAVRVGIGRAKKKTRTSFFAMPFDPEAAPHKKLRFWKNASEQEFYPQHCISRKPGAKFIFQSENLETLNALMGAADLAKPERARQRNWQEKEDHAAWSIICAKAEEAIRSQQIEKLVPARYLRLESDAVSWENYFSLLRDSSGEHTHRFLWRSDEEIFFGASPELLLHFDGERILVPAIAGTRPHSGNAESAAKELLSSDKDAREHELVVRDIVETLVRQGMKPERQAQAQALVLKNLVHLFTPIEAKLLPGLSLSAVAKALHPTAAVGGFPRAESRKILAEHENWDRGFYASPLGFVDEDGSGAFVVGIRSALFSSTGVTLFAGAGFVRGSSPEAEWVETRAKMKSMLGVFVL